MAKNPFSNGNSPMDRLVQRLSRLPGIGKRSAERIAFHLLKADPAEANDLAAAIVDLKRNARHCAICFNLAQGELCTICADTRRDQHVVMVVEQPRDVVSIETLGSFRGVYHVLMGRLSPLDGVGAGELTIAALMERLAPPDKRDNKHGERTITEVILATNPNVEGDTTALYLAQKIAASGVKVSRLARGLPAGSNLELVSKAVLADAIEGRQKM
jgi:recombination protein RecR